MRDQTTDRVPVPGSVRRHALEEVPALSSGPVRATARAVASILVIVVALAWTAQTLASGWEAVDLHIYLGAARNLVELGNPYLPSSATTDLLHFHYAPWFAVATVPLLALPLPLVEALWTGAMGISALAALAVLRPFGVTAVPLAVLMGVLLLGQVLAGNIQPLMVAMLIWRLDRRDGPLWVAVFASLKVIPIVFVAYYLGRRRWRDAALSVAITVVLGAPILLFEIPGGNLWPGATGLYAISPVLWAASAMIAGLLAIRLAGRRHGRLAAAVAAIAALPRLYPFDISTVLIGVPPRDRPDDR